jgi:lysophospholipase L1-like esterase
MRKHILTLCLAASFLTAALAQTAVTNLAVTPAGRPKDAWWPKRHEAKLQDPDRKQAALVFVGDSITQGWEGRGRMVWNRYYAPLHALNLGFSGDRTEHVLWRLEHGEVDGLSPKAVVVMIGTNNTGHRNDKPEDIAAGVKRICESLHAKLPQAKILLLAIFPRSAGAQDAPRVNNDRANELLAKLADGKAVFFANLNKAFLAEDGTLSRQIMPDLLHPDARGYDLWAETMAPHLAPLLK